MLLSLSLALSIINTISVSLKIRLQVPLCASAPSNGVHELSRSATKSETRHVSSYRKICVVSRAARRKHLQRLLIFQEYGLADHLSWLFSGTFHSSNSNFGPPRPTDLLNLERLAPWHYNKWKASTRLICLKIKARCSFLNSGSGCRLAYFSPYCFSGKTAIVNDGPSYHCLPKLGNP